LASRNIRADAAKSSTEIGVVGADVIIPKIVAAIWFGRRRVN
jgi:hypothetical protein